MTLIDQASSTQYRYLSILGRAKQALDSAVEVAVPASQLRPYLTQPREYFNPEGIRRLRISIAAGGQTTSGIIRKNPGETPYELIDGERRWRAISGIPEEDQPLYKAKLIEADEDVVQFLISGIANFNREGHTAIETTKTIDRLIGFDFPMEEIAAILGISVHWAYQLHGLKKLEPSVLALLDPELPRAKQLPVTAAIQISKIEGRFQAGLAQRVLNKDVSIGRLRTEVLKVAEKAGSSIRVREVDPRKKWESATKKSAHTMRALWDLKTLINNPEVGSYISSRPVDAKKIFKQLGDMQKTITACRERLLEMGVSP